MPVATDMQLPRCFGQHVHVVMAAGCLTASSSSSRKAGRVSSASESRECDCNPLSESGAWTRNVEGACVCCVCVCVCVIILSLTDRVRSGAETNAAFVTHLFPLAPPLALTQSKCNIISNDVVPSFRFAGHYAATVAPVVPHSG